jgi:hypothetical protein
MDKYSVNIMGLHINKNKTAEPEKPTYNRVGKIKNNTVMLTKVFKVKKAENKTERCCDCFGGGCRCRD